jgi:hypothetical protein
MQTLGFGKTICKAKPKNVYPAFQKRVGSRAESPCGFGQSPIRLKEYFGLLTTYLQGEAEKV